MSTQVNQPIVTVVVVPRESFNMFAEVVQRIYDLTSPIFKMIIMEGHAPKKARNDLEAIAAKHENCKIVYSDEWRFPHEFVNQAIPMIDTKYVVFIDNDVEVMEGWLENLVRTAEEKKAGCVHPIYLTVRAQDPSQKIHIAEGKLYREERNGKWIIDTIASYSGTSLKDYPNRTAKTSEFFEWHCVLFSKVLLNKVGLLDDLNIAEHLDYSLRIAQAGEKIFLEPKAVVCYEYERIWRFRGADRRYMLFRWDLNKVIESNERLQKNWNLDPESTRRRTYFAEEHTGRVKSTFFIPRAVNKVRRLVGLENMPYAKGSRPEKFKVTD